MMVSSLSIQTADFDIGAEIAALKSPKSGALVSFVGTVREAAENSAALVLWLEHYPGMTEQEIARIISAAGDRWPLEAVRVIHRIGRLAVSDNIVFVGVASAHRDAAFEAGRFIMDYLKSAAPFWKAEETEAGWHWVDARQDDVDALARWEAK